MLSTAGVFVAAVIDNLLIQRHQPQAGRCSGSPQLGALLQFVESTLASSSLSGTSILCSFHWRKAKGVSEQGVQNVPPGGENMLLGELNERVEGKVGGSAYNKVSTLPATLLLNDVLGNFRDPVLDVRFRV